MYKFPDYQNSLVNISNSILKHYAVATNHSTNPELDKILSKNFKHIFLVLIDGLGVNIINKHLNPTHFLYQNKKLEISSVYPPTTSAATTALLSGLDPIETGWIGWAQYFKNEDHIVVLFRNHDYYSLEKMPINITKKYLPYQSVIAKIKDKLVHTEAIMPDFDPNGYATFEEQIKRMEELSNSKQRTFAYCYNSVLDTLMHENGIDAQIVKEELLKENQLLDNFAKTLNKDSLLIILADHGHINVKPIDIFSYPDLMAMLVRNPSVEARTTCFHVKPEYYQQFPILFNQYFSNYFTLYTRVEFLNKGFLGTSPKHHLIDSFLGDYVAVASKNRFFHLEKQHQFKGHHGGLSEDELTIPVIIYYQ